ncbi:hypothetical protein C8Q79DRAFT_1012599 [Trametes meyenii]|nr:hypothetical protein C8Q79DRAFT_1012599 [Trametes meyenii]
MSRLSVAILLLTLTLALSVAAGPVPRSLPASVSSSVIQPISPTGDLPPPPTFTYGPGHPPPNQKSSSPHSTGRPMEVDFLS